MPIPPSHSSCGHFVLVTRDLPHRRRRANLRRRPNLRRVANPRHGALVLVTALLFGSAACGPSRAHSQTLPPGHAASAAEWIDAPLLGDTPLSQTSADDLSGRVVRLDRAIDMFDAARFSGDRATREAFWASLGGHPVGQGPAATRDALRSLFDEAMAIENVLTAAPQGLEEGPREFLADAIMMLTADLEQPQDAEALATRALAYRELAQRGHERLRDNAAWRLYDHARTTLAQALVSPSSRRFNIAVQTLYTAHEDVGPYFAEVPPHVGPPAPGADALWEQVAVPRDTLARDARWQPVLARRADEDANLHASVLATLPAARDPAWPMPEVERGTGRRDTLAPILQLTSSSVTVDLGRPQARTFPRGVTVESLSDRLAATVAQDGRGTLLFVVDPMIPAPDLHLGLRAVRRAQVARIELALHEAGDRADEAGRVVALPLEVLRSADAGPGAAALLQARLAVHLSGRGPTFFFDGRPLPSPETQPATHAQLDALRRAFPRETHLRLTLASDVAYPQLVDLLSMTMGGATPPFRGVGWWAGGAPEPEAGRPSPTPAQTLAHRLALRWERPQVELSAATNLGEDHQRGLRTLARRFFDCLPELERPLPEPRVTLGLRFTQGRLGAVELVGRTKIPDERRRAFTQCVVDQALGFRLQGVDEAVELRVVLADLPPPS